MEFGKTESDAERIPRKLHDARITKGCFEGRALLRVEPKESTQPVKTSADS